MANADVGLRRQYFLVSLWPARGQVANRFYLIWFALVYCPDRLSKWVHFADWRQGKLRQ